MRTSILLLALAVAACENSATVTENDESMGRLLADEHASPTVVREYFSGLTEPADLLITSNDQWVRIWASIYRNRTPAPTRPDVDFSREALVLSALGTSAGISNLIEGIRLFERGLVVRVVKERYSERCLVLTAIGQPVHVVRIARPEGRTVRVESRESVISCD